MCGDVCVVVETLRGEIKDITFTMLAGGRRLADDLKTKLSALLIGHDVQKLANRLGAADRVVCVEHANLAEFNPDAYLLVIAALFEQHRPRVVLFGHTAIGTDLACGVAERLHLPVATSCRTFAVDGGEVQYSALTCGGKLIATGVLPQPTCLTTVMAGGYKAEQGCVSRTPAIETVACPAGVAGQVRTNLKRYIEPPAGDVDIAKQPILVSVGRGIQNKDNITLAEELAQAMGGVVTGSRPVIDQEWLPTTRLVGKSGKQVKPKLYLALGISGAPEHAEGMRDADLIVAVNRDEKAPIFGFAHFGATVDVLALLPALTASLKQAQSTETHLMIERINFWGLHGGWHTLAAIITYGVLPLCALVMLVRVYLRIRLWWRVGRPEPRWDRLGARGQHLLKYALLQVKVWRQAYPGLMHFGLAWGFFVFFLGTALATIDADFVKFLRGPLYLGYKALLEFFTVVFLVGFVLAACRRFVQRPERLTLTAPFVLALLLIFLIVISGLALESLRLASIAQQPELQPGWQPMYGWITPAGWALAHVWLLLGLSIPALTQIHLGTWLGHATLVAAFFVMLPTGALAHVITAPLNVFFAKLDWPAGRLAPAFQRDGAVGVATLRDFTWKQLSDGDACTECGRCQDVCPAHNSGQPLSPKRVILAIRDALALHGPKLAADRDVPSARLPMFTGEVVSEAVAWACTTCRACVAECPVLIEHVDTLVDIRRALLAQQRADQMLTGALENLRRYGNSFGKSDKQRAKWTTGLDFKIKDIRKQPAHTLWFVGDYASYSPALTEATQAAARVFQAAGLDFGVLYDAERNAGNDLRRTGEEGLFELLAQKNVAALQKCQFEQIVTTDPHTYNTLRNEYLWTNGQTQALAAKFPVLHYAELLDRLLGDARLTVRRTLDCVVTYHDPCYLGRYNGVYDAPRRVLRALGCRLVEMPRNRERALCCGAGGGRIWMEEGKVQERPSESRVREAAALGGVQYFVVACPKDLTMYRDAVKTAGLEDRLVVKDLIELVDWATRAERDPAPSGAASASAAVSIADAG